jgi:hypothetical protein
VSALALPEAFDVLDAAWRLLFGKRNRLVALRAATDTAGLAQSASDRDAFQARIDDLAAILADLTVDDELIPEEVPENHRRGSLNRMESVLADRLGDDEDAHRLVAPLRHVVELRNGLTHSGAAGDLPSHAAGLGLEWPPMDWSAAWDTVRAAIVSALAEVRQELLRLVDE